MAQHVYGQKHGIEHPGPGGTIVSNRSDFVGHFRDRVSEHDEKDALIFLADASSGVTARSLSYRELDRRARRVAGWLAGQTKVGDRAILLFVPGPEFMVGFLGCLYAGVIAVPAPMPDSGGRGLSRLVGIAADAEVRVVLCENAVADAVAAWTQSNGLAYAAVDALEEGIEDAWQMPDIDASTVAFLQYTSGSTSEPKGVIVTHANLMHNEEEIGRAVTTTSDEIVCGWLPQFHDMGLIGLLLHPIYIGGTSVFMSPLTFLKRPYLWLWAVTEYRATVSVGPNFAFELATRRITEEQLATLDLSSVRAVLNGSEPIQAKALADFAKRFAAAGLDENAMFPCYGLAETTLFVTGSRCKGVVTRTIDSEALANNELVDAEDGRVLVSSGTIDRLEVRIVDPDTHKTLEPGQIGEIWVRGGSVAAGYWKQPEVTETTFHATTDGETDFLRTGDLGALLDGELYVTGRVKDMLIVNGRNLYPHDIEHVARQAHPAMQAGVGAAFVTGDRGRLVLVHEFKAAALGETSEAELLAAIRKDIRAEFDVHLSELVLVARGGVARTTSGKVRRGEMRDKFTTGELAGAVQ
jgi:acyl-CoA synthetase (AMP-forming)/AMP-acid ligase II